VRFVIEVPVEIGEVKPDRDERVSFPAPRSATQLVQPATILGWHRAGFRASITTTGALHDMRMRQVARTSLT
jgi:hypothetical protein